jgi:hypothetical protein
MRFLISFFIIAAVSLPGFSQNVQFYYDFRHSVDPELNQRNFPALSFEYFKDLDTVGTGSFLFQLDTQFDGKNCNMGQAFVQISQSLRFWKQKPGLSFYYSGGLGVTTLETGYHLTSAFGTGSSCTFQWKGAWIATALYFRITFFDKYSYDPQITLYFGKGFLHYRIFTDGSFVFWTENRDRGEINTENMKGKKFAFFGNPKIWIKVKGGLSAGFRVNVFYNLIGEEGQLQFYPATGIKYQF